MMTQFTIRHALIISESATTLDSAHWSWCRYYHSRSSYHPYHHPLDYQKSVGKKGTLKIKNDSLDRMNLYKKWLKKCMSSHMYKKCWFVGLKMSTVGSEVQRYCRFQPCWLPNDIPQPLGVEINFQFKIQHKLLPVWLLTVTEMQDHLHEVPLETD